MAKVTEQDLIKLGFKRKWLKDKSDYWYEKSFKHKIIGKFEIIIDNNEISARIGFEYHTKPLTHANLDLFIRFAEGKKL